MDNSFLFSFHIKTVWSSLFISRFNLVQDLSSAFAVIYHSTFCCFQLIFQRNKSNLSVDFWIGSIMTRVTRPFPTLYITLIVQCPYQFNCKIFSTQSLHLSKMHLVSLVLLYQMHQCSLIQTAQMHPCSQCSLIQTVQMHPCCENPDAFSRLHRFCLSISRRLVVLPSSITPQKITASQVHPLKFTQTLRYYPPTGIQGT